MLQEAFLARRLHQHMASRVGRLFGRRNVPKAHNLAEVHSRVRDAAGRFPTSSIPPSLTRSLSPSTFAPITIQL